MKLQITPYAYIYQNLHNYYFLLLIAVNLIKIYYLEHYYKFFYFYLIIYIYIYKCTILYINLSKYTKHIK